MANITDAELTEAKASWEEERFHRAIPQAVRYDRLEKCIAIVFENGETFSIPCHKLRELDNAQEDELEAVQLLGETGLHWEKLDVDYSISGLMSGSSVNLRRPE
jgi:hypothetical protein